MESRLGMLDDCWFVQCFVDVVLQDEAFIFPLGQC